MPLILENASFRPKSRDLATKQSRERFAREFKYSRRNDLRFLHLKRCPDFPNSGAITSPFRRRPARANENLISLSKKTTGWGLFFLSISTLHFSNFQQNQSARNQRIKERLDKVRPARHVPTKSSTNSRKSIVSSYSLVKPWKRAIAPYAVGDSRIGKSRNAIAMLWEKPSLIGMSLIIVSTRHTGVLVSWERFWPGLARWYSGISSWRAEARFHVSIRFATE